MARYLALDLGTTAIKCAVFDDEGRRVAFARVPYDLRYPRENWVECAPQTYLDAIEKAVAACRGNDVAAVALSSQANTLLCIDSDGQPLRDAIVWTDFRAREEAATLKHQIGEERFSAATGAPDLSGALFPCKIMWLRRHEPQTLSATRRFLDIKQWVMAQLGGPATADPSLRGIEGLGKIDSGALWSPILEAAGIAPEQLAPLGATQEPGAHVSAAWAEKIGCTRGTPIINGCLDQVAAGVGAGCVEPGTAALNFGGVLAFFAAVKAGSVKPGTSYLTGPHAQPGCWYVLPYLPAAGLAIEWLIRTFGAGRSVEALAAEAERVPAGCDGLLALPHLTGLPHRGGERIRGGFIGLANHHTPAHLYRALIESFAFSTLGWINELERAGLRIDQLRALGGGTRSALWLKIVADATGLPVELPREPEASCLGAAMLAAWGTGRWPDLPSVGKAWIKIERVVEPDRSVHEVYQEAFERHRAFSAFSEGIANR